MALPTSQKIILLALADLANDAGECGPRVRDIAAKVSMSERAAQFHLGQLEKQGAIVRIQHPGNITLYRVTV